MISAVDKGKGAKGKSITLAPLFSQSAISIL